MHYNINVNFGEGTVRVNKIEITADDGSQWVINIDFETNELNLEMADGQLHKNVSEEEIGSFLRDAGITEKAINRALRVI